MKNMRSAVLAALPCAALFASVGASAAAPDVLFDTVAAPAGVKLAAMPDAAPMTVILSLPLRDRAGAEAYGAAVSEPGNKLYGHYLTPKEFGARFGGDAAAYDFLRNWATAQGLAVGERMDSRTIVSLGGTAAQFARLFSTRFAGFYTPEHGDGYVMLRAPRVPDALAGKIDGVVGLSSAAHYAPLLLKRPVNAALEQGTGPGGGFAPKDIETAYDVPAQVGGKTEILGLFEEGGFYKKDVTFYQNYFKLPAIPVVPRSVDGQSTKPVANGIDIESALDFDSSSAINPALSKIIVYEDGKGSFSSQLVNAFNAMAQDNTAKVISVSYGIDETMQGQAGANAENTALMQLQTQGQTVFVSSGDDGAAGRSGSGLNAPDPGSQPLVTCVGGTTLDTNQANQDWMSETTWGGTGGGVSMFWNIPSWQVVNGVSVAKANGGSSTKRNVPDIAAVADPNTGYAIYLSHEGGWQVYGGTSLSSPIWGGFATIINAARVQAGKARIGFFNPLLYQLGVTETGFHDITQGNNGSPGFKAGKGYDNTTGFGSLDVAKFLPTITQ